MAFDRTGSTNISIRSNSIPEKLDKASKICYWYVSLSEERRCPTTLGP